MKKVEKIKWFILIQLHNHWGKRKTSIMSPSAHRKLYARFSMVKFMLQVKLVEVGYNCINKTCLNQFTSIRTSSKIELFNLIAVYIYNYKNKILIIPIHRLQISMNFYTLQWNNHWGFLTLSIYCYFYYLLYLIIFSIF